MESIRSTSQINSTARRIIFFDGYCSLCNRWVDFLLRVLRARKKESAHFSYKIASLQSKAAQEVLGATQRTDLFSPPFNSIVVFERVAGTVNESVFYTESDAILRIFSGIEFPWSMFAIFRFIPRSIRDAIYRLMANNRYRWFGKRDTCRLPTSEEKEFMLD